MIFTEKIYRAIKFAAKTHQVYQDQRRKGKAVPYITHPLTVGLILSLYGAEEDLICAGILHDTIEDSPEDKKVTKEMLQDRFGERVAELVQSVTDNKSLKTEARKQDVLNRIESFSNDSVLVKSADVISNMSEMLDDYGREGDVMFKKFTENKEKTIQKYLDVTQKLLIKWPENPARAQLLQLSEDLSKLG